MLNFICQLVSHCARLFRSSCKIRQSMGDFIFLYNTQSSAKRRTDDLIFSGRSLIKTRKRTRQTDPWGTPDRTGTGSEAWPSNTTFFECSESHDRVRARKYFSFATSFANLIYFVPFSKSLSQILAIFCQKLLCYYR